MKMIVVEGDLVRSDEPCIVHGCNDHGVMGSGIAKQIKTDYPQAYMAYRERFDNHGLAPGEIIPVECQSDDYPNKWVINAITQHNFNRTGGGTPGVFVDYDGLRTAFKSINQFAKENGIERIGMPLIGAVRGGGDWNVISAIIEEEATDYQPVLYKFVPPDETYKVPTI